MLQASDLDSTSTGTGGMWNAAYYVQSGQILPVHQPES
jgi:hypothetical protein